MMAKRYWYICFLGMFIGLYSWLLYWLMPVTFSSMLSADHFRWVFAKAQGSTGWTDQTSVVPETLNSLWILILEALKLVYGSGVYDELVARGAAVSSGLMVLSGVFLLVVALKKMRETQKLVEKIFLLCMAVAVLLIPIVLWVGVLPNGLVLSCFFVSLIGLWGTWPMILPQARLIAMGLASGVTPAAWPLVLFQFRTLQRRFLGWYFFGIAILPCLKLLLEGRIGTSISWLPVYTTLRAIRYEDILAGPQMLMFPMGESAAGVIASFFILIPFGIWHFKQSSWRLGVLLFAFVLQFIQSHWRAARIAHPGWNTVLEDSALNSIRTFAGGSGVILVNGFTDEALVRVVVALGLDRDRKGPSHNREVPSITAMLSRKIFDAGEIERVQKLLPKYSVEEALAASQQPEDEMKRRYKDGTDMLLQSYVLPNVQRGVTFFFGAHYVTHLVDLLATEENGIVLRYFANGVQLSRLHPVDGELAASGARQEKSYQDFSRNNLKSGYVRARLGYFEGLLRRSVEVQDYENYAIYHLMRASLYSLKKEPADWLGRGRAELGAALSKVPWLEEPYAELCETPLQKPPSEIELSGSDQQTAAAPLDICQYIAKAKGRSSL